jgi:hypothetical protein
MQRDPRFVQYDHILSLLKGLYYAGSTGNAYAQCPAHDDGHASLSLKIGRKGQLLCKCHAKAAGCTFDTIAAALGVPKKEFFPPEDGKAGETLAKRVEAKYDYLAADGTVAYRVVRLANPKAFFQQRPDPANPGKWLASLDEVEPVPFGLPRLLHADRRQQVIVVEGEKKAIALEKLGFLATCNSGGAEKWPISWGLQYFAERPIAVLPDNDEAGWRHAYHVARSLAPFCGPVRLVELPGLHLKDDVVDWLDRLNHLGPLGKSALLSAAIRSSPIVDLDTDAQVRLAHLRLAVARGLAMSLTA